MGCGASKQQQQTVITATEIARSDRNPVASKTFAVQAQVEKSASIAKNEFAASPLPIVTVSEPKSFAVPLIADKQEETHMIQNKASVPQEDIATNQHQEDETNKILPSSAISNDDAKEAEVAVLLTFENKLPDSVDQSNDIPPSLDTMEKAASTPRESSKSKDPDHDVTAATQPAIEPDHERLNPEDKVVVEVSSDADPKLMDEVTLEEAELAMRPVKDLEMDAAPFETEFVEKTPPEDDLVPTTSGNGVDKSMIPIENSSAEVAACVSPVTESEVTPAKDTIDSEVFKVTPTESTIKSEQVEVNPEEVSSTKSEPVEVATHVLESEQADKEAHTETPPPSSKDHENISTATTNDSNDQDNASFAVLKTSIPNIYHAAIMEAEKEKAEITTPEMSLNGDSSRKPSLPELYSAAMAEAEEENLRRQSTSAANQIASEGKTGLTNEHDSGVCTDHK